MSDSLVDAVAEHISRDPATLASLPLPLAQRIFLALPADARGRSSCVCRAWRDVLADPSLWTRLEMSVVRVEPRCFLPVLHGAARRSRGQLRELEILPQQRRVVFDDFLPLLTANSGSLRELHLQIVHVGAYEFNPYAQTGGIEAIMAAAPLLQVLTAEDVTCTWEEAPRVLRAEPPFALLQMRHGFSVRFASGDDDEQRIGGMDRFGPFAAAMADATLRPALLRLCVCQADAAQPALMGALVDAALARRLRELKLFDCTPPAVAPLVRLLAEGSLYVLEISLSADWTPLFYAAGAALVADALRVNTTLTKLDLYCTGLSSDMLVAGTLLGALVRHPSLRELSITGEYIAAAEHRGAFGAALGALIAADAPALHVLDCSYNRLGDAGLAPIVEALALNRHLRALDCHSNGTSEAFARERLLPAVRANATLREFKCINGGGDEPAPALAEAEELLRLRGLQN